MAGSIDEKMQKAIESVKRNLATVRTGRANPDILKRIVVDYYGAMTPIQQLANLSAPEPKILSIQVFDGSAVQAVAKAIMKSDLGLTPNTEGNIIRLVLPELTQERRKEMEKLAGKIAEEGKISIRNVRRDELDELKQMEKEKLITEDEKKRESDNIQKVTDKYIKMVDELLAAKEKDLNEI